MSRHSILTVDLNKDVPGSSRDVFYDELKKYNWVKLPNLTTVWYGSWKDGITDQDIVSGAKEEVRQAAEKAKIQHYDACVAICGTPTTWNK